MEQWIRRIFLDSRRLYGSRKIKEVLEQQDFHVSGKTLSRIMKELELRSRTVKKNKATTNSKHHLPVYDNVLDREFKAEAPNRKWVADITYTSI
ncbi:IS3 family transposase [Paenibacillus sp.]|uniref:IS3 family transposase n=1 Tax=Paenibacillus sp. TaxID=58172 RepID=UPI0028B187F8|nr:IS3 family transposase [Paenibacillus sp.]